MNNTMRWVEILVIVVPVTVVYLIGVFFAATLRMIAEPLVFMCVLVGFSGVLSAWKLLLRAVEYGAVSTLDGLWPWWICSFVALGLSVAALVWPLGSFTSGNVTQNISLQWFSAGSLLSIPLVHLAWEATRNAQDDG